MLIREIEGWLNRENITEIYTFMLVYMSQQKMPCEWFYSYCQETENCRF